MATRKLGTLRRPPQTSSLPRKRLTKLRHFKHRAAGAGFRSGPLASAAAQLCCAVQAGKGASSQRRSECPKCCNGRAQKAPNAGCRALSSCATASQQSPPKPHSNTSPAPEMTVITLQIGQCGNTLGAAWFAELWRQAERAEGADPALAAQRRRRWFRRKRSGESVPRAVLLDTEPKVVQRLLGASRRCEWGYDAGGAICEALGSGNNWAVGYAMQSAKLREGIEERVRAEAEKTDQLDAFHVLHSSAGGTGSGLGSFATEMLADWDPNPARLNTLVFPYHSGEVIVQNYNALLSLGHLQDVSDAMILLENQTASDILTAGLQVEKPTLQQLNGELARPLATVLNPGDGPEGSDGLHSAAAFLCPNPATKWLSLWSVPQTKESSAMFTRNNWTGLLRRLSLMVQQRQPLEMRASPTAPVGNGVRAVQVALHGDAAGKLAGKDFQAIAELPETAGAWRIVRSEAPTSNVDRTCAALSNCQYGVQVVERIVEKSERMLQSRAYLHQYEKYGVGSDTFAESYSRVQQVVARYEDVGFA
eukprot:scaffold576_cov260-Pinguiococcus_pyrenoidosus.AAC.38